ncbi:hypothetical protein P152DRAFT_303218 [Eremomyces bilateralis CBS 781.70]|uniref:DUF1688-domain-containing protein n=1 Tax=Eremomyces bilateralis CBS 781.70 TaxID=1392243 RepID=A0A6G1G7T2_9PEZI|nr:uncharacterized protein P152DRAFT_303218 [Eremomyces bilateralis CBS 781.70]KAF1814062.1 hypothetical protein P152DRAFT_303218 [Eremomyces bilateralis CBS 781.70]
MGLFSRKQSKQPLSSTDDSKSIQSNRSSSHKSPLSSINGQQFGMKSQNLLAEIPDIPLPRAPDPLIDPVKYLKSIYAVRERTRLVLETAKRNQLKHFTVDLGKFDDAVSYVVAIIKRDYGSDFASIPPHGRWQHFDVGGRPRVDQMMQTWPLSIDALERCRRLIDLFVVSVLLDAGAGSKWQYKSKENSRIYRRSEGLAVASLEMFKAGVFSNNPEQPFQVDSEGLSRITEAAMRKGLQVTDQNPIDGLEGRTQLLIKLSDALQNQAIFGVDSRPGNMLDYLLSHPTTHASSVPIIPLPTLWDLLMDGLGPIWPQTRTHIDGVPLGDAWPCSIMPSHPTHPWESIVPFHKLTQWLCYSIMVPMTKLLQVHFAGAELLTGLPEYRNGGLFVDTGLMTLKPDETQRGLEQYRANAERLGQPSMEVVPMFTADDDVIVEWRAATVGFLDELLIEVNKMLGLSGSDCLSLAQMLEAGSWKGGRELAEVSRPNTKEPPIMIFSDGTVF